MKTIKITTLVLALVSTLLSCKKETVEPIINEELWSIETIDETGKPTSMNKLAVDLDGGKHVAYVDVVSSSNANIKYAYKAKDGSWKTEFIDSEGNCEDWVTMAIDTVSQKIHVAYIKTGQPVGSGTDEHLIMAEKAIGSSTWTKIIVQGELNNSSYPAITVDKNQGIHISYMRGGSYQLYHAYRPLNGNFTITKVDEGGWGTSSIDVDESLNIHIVYYNNNTIKCAHKNISGDDWTISTIREDVSSSSHVAALPMAMNNNVPTFLLTKHYNQRVLEIAEYQSSWNFKVFNELKPWGKFSLDLFCRNGNKYISYKEMAGTDGQGYNVRVVYSINGSAWKTEFVDGSSDNRCGEYNSLFVEKDSTINISYTADTKKILKFAYKKIVK